MEIANEFLLKNYVSIVLVSGILAVVFTSDKRLDHRVRSSTLQLIVLCVILIVADFIDHQLSIGENYYIWRTVCAVIGYAGRPAIGWCFIGMGIKNKKRYLLLMIPLFLNLILYCTGFWINLAFYIDPADNHWSRGPLWWVNIAISAFYMVLAVISARRKTDKNRKTSIIIFMAVLFCVVSAVLEALNSQPGVLYPTVIVALLFVYIYLLANDMVKQLSLQDMELKQQQINLSLSQLQPHFISNGMVTIRRLIKTNPNRAVESMDYFIDYLRKTIDSIEESELVPVDNELEFVQDYLYIEKLRFGASLQYEIIDNGSDFKIPAFTLQPIVENAIRHGIRKKEDGAGHLVVEVMEDPIYHIIRISDDGVGYDTTKEPAASDGHHHIGVKNSRYRLETMCGGSYIVDSVIGKGTTVTLKIPKTDPGFIISEKNT